MRFTTGSMPTFATVDQGSLLRRRDACSKPLPTHVSGWLDFDLGRLGPKTCEAGSHGSRSSAFLKGRDRTARIVTPKRHSQQRERGAKNLEKGRVIRFADALQGAALYAAAAFILRLSPWSCSGQRDEISVSEWSRIRRASEARCGCEMYVPLL